MSRTRRASTSPTTPKRPLKYPSTIPQDQADDKVEDLSILDPMESGLAGETFPMLSASVGTLSAPASASAAIPHDLDLRSAQQEQAGHPPPPPPSSSEKSKK